MAAYIYAGDQIVVPIRFLEDSAPANPTTVTFTTTDPNGNQVAYAYGSGDVVERSTTGNYTATFTPGSAGFWSYEWSFVTPGGTETATGSFTARAGQYFDEAGGTLATFEGGTRPALITTGEIQPTPLKQTLFDELWPEIDSDSSDVTGFVTTRSRRSQALAWGGSKLTWGGAEIIFGAKGTNRYESDLNSHGFCPVRLSSRYVQMGIEVAAGVYWTEANGMSWRGSAAGER